MKVILNKPNYLLINSTAIISLSVCVFLFNSCKEEETIPPPTITSFSPTSGSTGTVVNISGTNFNTSPANNSVKFNGTSATVTAATPLSLTVAVPAGAATGKITITTNGNTASSETDFTVFNSPEIISFSPISGPPGTAITITGKNFSTTPIENSVKFNNLAATVTSATATSLTVTVPPDATTGKMMITVNGLTTLSTNDFIVPPTVESFSPVSGIIGSSVTITGTGFNITIANNLVKFNNKTATVSTATTTSLTVTVPIDASTDKITVTVNGQTATSSNDFTIIPTISNFSPIVGAIGSSITIIGTGFSAIISNNTVKFNGTAATITASTVTSLIVVVPVGATTGKITVAVGANIITSSTDYDVVVEVVKEGGSGFDQGNSVAVDASGNTFVTGWFTGTTTFGNSSLTSLGLDDAFLAKYNSLCDLIWVKQIGGSGSDNSLSIAIDVSGHIYTTGTFTGTVSFGTTSLISSNGSGDIFIAKFNSSGDAIWAKQIGSGASNVETGFSVQVDASGDLLLTGSFFGTVTLGTINLTSAGSSDVLVAKYNSASGNVIWAKGFGGTDSDTGSAVSSSTLGVTYVSGSFFGTASFGTINLISAGGLDAFITKLNSTGDVVWAKQISGPIWENAFSLASDANGNCYVSGYFTETTTLGSITLTSVGNEDAFLAKYSSSGDVLWAKSCGGTNYDQSHSVAIDAAGNAYITGYFTQQATFGDKILTSNNNSRDIFITKFNSSGNIVWAKQSGGIDTDEGLSVTLDPSSTVYITGYFKEISTFGSTPMTSRGIADIYLWKIRQ